LENVKKTGQWAGRTKVYEGPLIAFFNVGKGNLGLELEARRRALIEASDRCSTERFVGNFF
jgi:hypothetical protein